MEIILQDNSKFHIRFEEDATYGSLRPIIRGGRREYFCSRCFSETKSPELSIIPLHTPHWTQSLYPDGVADDRNRLTVRVCDTHAIQHVRACFPEDLVTTYEIDNIYNVASGIILLRKHIKCTPEEIKHLLLEHFQGVCNNNE